MTEAEGLTPPVKWGQVGRAVTLGGGAERQIGGLFKEPTKFKHGSCIQRAQRRDGDGGGSWEGGVEPRPSFSSSFTEGTEVPFYPHTDTCWRAGEGEAKV